MAIRAVTTIDVEYGGAEGLEPPKRFYKGGSAPAEILLNLIAVTILANPKTLDVAKKRQHSDIVHSDIVYFINYSRFTIYSNIQPIHAVLWLKLVTNVV